jgi:hypothetical protein
MRRNVILSAFVVLLAAATALALNPSSEVFVPAAARGPGANGSVWVTDLYLFNPGVTTVAADVYWLPRDTDNSGASPVSFTLAGGETLVLEDVILETFGFDSGAGAFRIVGTGSLVVNSRIYNLSGSATFGQGFEGIPASAALTAGSSTDVVGLSENSAFRTNVFAVNTGASTATIDLELRDSNGTTLASRSYDLPPYAAFYRNITDLGASSFAAGTLHAEVTAGSAMVVGSKVDNGSGDPTTLEAWWQGGAGTDGTYYLAIYDSLGYATGGSLVVENGSTSLLDVTYTNWDKVDGSGNPQCTWIFIASAIFDPPYTLSELASGVTFSNTYTDPDGTIEWTFTLTPGQGAGLTGTVAAAGSGFSGDAAGCNGDFPVQTIMGGLRP